MVVGSGLGLEFGVLMVVWDLNLWKVAALGFGVVLGERGGGGGVLVVSSFAWVTVQ